MLTYHLLRLFKEFLPSEVILIKKIKSPFCNILGEIINPLVLTEDVKEYIKKKAKKRS